MSSIIRQTSCLQAKGQHKVQICLPNSNEVVDSVISGQVRPDVCRVDQCMFLACAGCKGMYVNGWRVLGEE